MQKYITYEDKIGEIILDARHPQSSNKVFILVEGDDDLKFYGKFLNNFCKIEPIPGGVTELEISLEMIPKNVRKINLLGIRDADFMHIENKKPSFSNLFLTDTHDTETMLISSEEAFKAVFHEFLPKNSIDIDRLRTQFLSTVEFLGYLRWYNNIHNLEFNFNGLGLEALISLPNLFIDELMLIKNILHRSPNAQNTDENKILKEVKELTQNSFSLLQICCGHDVMKVIATYFKTQNKLNAVSHTRIASQLRTAYNINSFEKTALYNNLSSYAQNEGLNIFI